MLPQSGNTSLAKRYHSPKAYIMPLLCKGVKGFHAFVVTSVPLI